MKVITNFMATLIILFAAAVCIMGIVVFSASYSFLECSDSFSVPLFNKFMFLVAAFTALLVVFFASDFVAPTKMGVLAYISIGITFAFFIGLYFSSFTYLQTELPPLSGCVKDFFHFFQ